MARLIANVDQIRCGAQKAADWIESQQSANGSIDRAGGIGSIYKTTFTLVVSGRLHAAWRLMDFIAETWMTQPGEFHVENETPFDKATAFYRNTYILRAALCLGRFDIASPAAMDRLFRYQHRSGGFCMSLKPSERHRIGPTHTSMGGWLSLYTARLDRAGRAGDFLLKLIRSQPDMSRRFYINADASSGRCIRTFESGTAFTHVCDTKIRKQQFFHVGAMMGFLSDLYRATGKMKYLRGAEKLFAHDQRMHPRSFEWASKCKVGWGSALLHSVTGKAAQRRVAKKVARVTMLNNQRRDGSWAELLFPTRDDGSGVMLSSMELTSEFTFELCEMAKALSR